jgi:type IV pilus assembly protein PilO
MKKLISLLNLHIAVAAALLIFNLVLGVRLFLGWRTLHAAGPEELQQQQTALRALQQEMSPLHGLPQKVDQSRTQADEFYAARFPSAYSTISTTISDLAIKNSVRETNLAYTPFPAIAGLSQLRLDASLSGEYPSMMHFINALERSKTFFLISGITLTGQQGGMVNLRLRLITYLHAADPGLLPPVNDSEQPAGEEGAQ